MSKTFKKLIVPFENDAQKEIIMAWLYMTDIDSIVEQEKFLEVYNASNDYKAAIANLVEKTALTKEQLKIESLESRNWNAEWEANFKPIEVGKVYIRAPFHDQPDNSYTDLVIAPKMAFGTGHHETTHMMISYLSQLDLSGKKVLDYGCGTGILAVYAIMQGAAHIDCNDIEAESVDNTHEHIALNRLPSDKFSVKLGDLDVFVGNKYDIILANINRHVLLRQAHNLKNFIAPGGLLIMSGILQTDKTLVTQTYKDAGFILKDEETRGEWCRFGFMT